LETTSRFSETLGIFSEISSLIFGNWCGIFWKLQLEIRKLIEIFGD